MVLAAVQAAMHLEDKKSLHPFFSKPSKDQASAQGLSVVEPHDDSNHDPDYESINAKPVKGRQKRTRNLDDVKTGKGTRGHAKNQASLDTYARRPKVQDAGEDTQVHNNVSADVSLTEDPNQHHRKRRKTESPQPVAVSAQSVQPAQEPSSTWYQQLEAGAASGYSAETGVAPEAAANTNFQMTDASLPHSGPPAVATTLASLDSNAPVDGVDCEPPLTPTKKQIKVTKSGKLVSSPPEPESQPLEPTRTRRGRKPNKLPKANCFSTVTVIKYGLNPLTKYAIGQRIDAILNSKPSQKHAAASKKALPKPAGPPKVTHPFFSGKDSQKKEDAQTDTVAKPHPLFPRKSAVTPGKLQAEARREQSPGPTLAFGMSARNSRFSNQAGLIEPSWPTKDSAHVRSLNEEDAAQYTRLSDLTDSLLKPRKMKRSAVSLPMQEDAITKLAQQLKQQVQWTDTIDHGFPPLEDVRLPKRLLTTGPEIQRRVREQVNTWLRAPDEEYCNNEETHPAINDIFNDIEHTLTPFDKGECEIQTWAQKYSPKSASHVLQPGVEANVLKDWLQSLTVMAVGGASQKSTSLTNVQKPPKKKRKTNVDDFIISDDEEEEEDMVQLPGTGIINSYQAPSLRRPRWTRNQNVVLISGPHGCGKSATVYAVAKELDFEVFEINSGVRRSGKDIQDKVGDMTANHLVNHKRGGAPPEEMATPATTAEETDNERMDDEIQKDLDSGRQGTMMSFFKTNNATNPKPRSKAKVKSQVPEAKRPTITTAQATLPLSQISRKSQKQSLILIEEADILFEEDQYFWAQVTKLASQSKRPIIITCNDELQIPIDDLPLGALLRLSPPPTDLATDYMLVLAGREGHILDRQAVQDLYESKQHDLRASIIELDLWCQMSVGDQKGGLEWMYQRWPPGKDVDAHGRLLRVASECTYQTGMGWLSHNVFESKDNISFDKEEELLKETWQDWGISPEQWIGGARGTSEPSVVQNGNVQECRLEDLRRLSTFADARSAADLYCQVDLPSYDCIYDQPLDPTIPPMAAKDRQNYTLAAPVLHTDAHTDFLGLDTSISTQTELLIRRIFPDLVHCSSTSPPGVVESEMQYAEHILDRKHAQNTCSTLSRLDCSAAFDILATPPDHVFSERTSFILTSSSFDRTFSILILDLAPYVRSIVNHELALETQRIRLGNLLSEGGQLKRSRNSRASRTALEGGTRQAKRRERWFPSELNFDSVLKTAGRSWAGMGWKGEDVEEESGSCTGTQDSMDDVQAPLQVMCEERERV